MKPPNAPSIWFEAGTIYLELPGVISEATHTIKVNADAKGIHQVFKLLAARSESSKIGETGDATQAQVAKWKPNGKVIKKAVAKPSNPKALEILKGMGLI